MLSMVLGPRRGDGPKLPFEVQLTPLHTPNFIAALTGEDEQPDNPAVIIIPALVPDRREFCLGQNSVARFDRGSIGPGDRIGRDIVALADCPVEQCR